MPSEYDPERDAPNSNGASPPKLVKFRHMTGINTPASLVVGVVGEPPRPAPNLGIYARIVMEEQKAVWEYSVVSAIIDASFFGQIIVAATLTAISASNTSHIAVTVLGSLNTIIAGIQTYLKGQGLPNRIRQYQFGLRKLREYMEDREREFSHDDCKLNVDHVIKDVAAMYQAVRQTAEDNTPDTYLPMAGAGKKLLGQKESAVGGANPKPPNAEEAAGDAAQKIDTAAAAEDAEAGKTAPAETGKAAPAEASQMSKLGLQRVQQMQSRGTVILPKTTNQRMGRLLGLIPAMRMTRRRPRFYQSSQSNQR